MNLGPVDAPIASIVGNWLLFICSAAMAFAAGLRILNPELVLAVFGPVGAILPGLLLVGLVVGLFGFHIARMVPVLFRPFESSRNATAIASVLFAEFAFSTIVSRSCSKLPACGSVFRQFCLCSVNAAAAVGSPREHPQPDAFGK